MTNQDKLFYVAGAMSWLATAGLVAGIYIPAWTTNAVAEPISTQAVADPVGIYQIMAEPIIHTPKQAVVDWEDIPTVVRKVYQLESSGGKNDRCKRLGEGVNGYGFAVFGGNYPCWKTHEEITAKVSDWYKAEKDRGSTLAESLCRYNTGKRSNGCEYYEKYLRIR